MENNLISNRKIKDKSYKAMYKEGALIFIMSLILEILFNKIISEKMYVASRKIFSFIYVYHYVGIL